MIKTHKDNFDFLQDIPDFDFDMIITNPPYSLKDEFIKKCYEYKKPFCLLLPITSLEGIERGKMYRENGIELLVFDRRCNFIYNDAKSTIIIVGNANFIKPKNLKFCANLFSIMLV